MNAVQKSQSDQIEFERLFVTLAEELKLPLIQIAREAELEQSSPRTSIDGLRSIQASADITLRLLDSYLLSLRLTTAPEPKLLLEPVSVAAVLHDTAQELNTIAKQYGVELELFVKGRYEPVIAHRHGLQSALVTLGYALIEALPAVGVHQMRLQLASHRTSQGIVAGVYGAFEGLTPQALRRAIALKGKARQPLVDSLPGGAAGVFIADTILQAMSSHLRVGRYQKLPGFAATLHSSEQLQLV